MRTIYIEKLLLLTIHTFCIRFHWHKRLLLNYKGSINSSQHLKSFKYHLSHLSQYWFSQWELKLEIKNWWKCKQSFLDHFTHKIFLPYSINFNSIKRYKCFRSFKSPQIYTCGKQLLLYMCPISKLKGYETE